MSQSGLTDQLTLFDCGGVDLSALRIRRDELLASVRAKRTISAYACDWRQFDRWCRMAGRETLPASAETLQLYITWMFEGGSKVTTAERRVAAIAHIHRGAGFNSPVEPNLREIIRATRRERKEKPIGKKALSPLELVRIAGKCDATTALGSRDLAILILGFATSFRREELAQLQLSDVTFERDGLAVLLRYSKRDQEGKGRLLGVWAGERESTDPVRTLRAWLKWRGDWDGPLFCRIQTGDIVQHKAIAGAAVHHAVRRMIAEAGIDPKRYGAHSLRAGSITAAAELGRSDQEIIGLSGHANVQMIRTYVRSSRLFSGRNPLAGVL
ncbi:MAG TPA: tyrosine-type recombinase/integrase [Candidatus Acidoferrales bacterium]|jgi:integrase